MVTGSHRAVGSRTAAVTSMTCIVLTPFPGACKTMTSQAKKNSPVSPPEKASPSSLGASGVDAGGMGLSGAPTWTPPISPGMSGGAGIQHHHRFRGASPFLHKPHMETEAPSLYSLGGALMGYNCPSGQQEGSAPWWHTWHYAGLLSRGWSKGLSPA